jgi:hypothetical protein
MDQRSAALFPALHLCYVHIASVTAISHIGNAASPSNTVKPPIDGCVFEKLHLFSFHPLLSQNVTLLVMSEAPGNLASI